MCHPYPQCKKIFKLYLILNFSFIKQPSFLIPGCLTGESREKIYKQRQLVDSEVSCGAVVNVRWSKITRQ